MAEAEVGQAEGDRGAFGIDFGDEPGGGADGGEELDDRRVVAAVAAAVGEEVVALRGCHEVHGGVRW